MIDGQNWSMSTLWYHHLLSAHRLHSNSVSGNIVPSPTPSREEAKLANSGENIWHKGKITTISHLGYIHPLYNLSRAVTISNSYSHVEVWKHQQLASLWIIFLSSPVIFSGTTFMFFLWIHSTRPNTLTNWDQSVCKLQGVPVSHSQHLHTDSLEKQHIN